MESTSIYESVLATAEQRKGEPRAGRRQPRRGRNGPLRSYASMSDQKQSEIEWVIMKAFKRKQAWIAEELARTYEVPVPLVAVLARLVELGVSGS
jgi:hypothetical protein